MITRYIFASLAGLSLIVGCRPSMADGNAESVLSIIGEESEQPNISHLPSDRRNGADDGVLVIGYPEIDAFWTTSTSDDLEQYPCSECHTSSLAQMGRGAIAEQDRAHWNVTLEHADSTVMDCTTCHDSQDAQMLTTLNNQTLELDHSYRVCAQCHSGIAQDWAGGAHGKRIGGWTPPRIVTNCVSCHDPHQPAWDTRWPARAGRADIP